MPAPRPEHQSPLYGFVKACPCHTHSTASCGGFSGERGHGVAAPRPVAGTEKPFLLGITGLSQVSMAQGQEGGNCGPAGRPLGTGKRCLILTLAVAGVGAPRPAAWQAGRNGARNLPAGPWRVRLGLAQLRRRQGHRQEPCAASACACRAAGLGASRGVGSSLEGLGGGGKRKQKRLDAERSC